MSSFLKYISEANLGPALVTGIAGIVIGGLYINEQIKLKDEKPLLHKALSNLWSNNPDDRQAAVSDLIEELQKRGSRSKEEVEETRDLIFDYGALKALHKIIAKAGPEEVATVHDALKAILYILDGGVEKRKQLIRIGGLKTLAQLFIPDGTASFANSNIRELAGLALRKVTRFDVELRELEDDIPSGSEGGNLLAQILTDTQYGELNNLLLQKSPSTNVKSAVAIVAHISQTKRGVEKLLLHRAYNPLIAWTTARSEDSKRKQLRHNVITALGNISNRAFSDMANIVARAEVIEAVIDTVDPRGSFKVLSAVINVLYATAMELRSEADPERRENVAGLLLKHKEKARIIFDQTESKNLDMREKVIKLERLFSARDYVPASFEHIRAILRHVRDAQIQRKKEQADKQRQQEMMMMNSMMGGMGGMGMMGMPGMGGGQPSMEEILLAQKLGLI